MPAPALQHHEALAGRVRLRSARPAPKPGGPLDRWQAGSGSISTAVSRGRRFPPHASGRRTQL
eukprot:261270-Alexandrium_andersonii.AAC.1